MKESDEFDLKLTKQEIDFLLNLIHNRTKPHTALSFDLQVKLLSSLGMNVSDTFGRPSFDRCPECGCADSSSDKQYHYDGCSKKHRG